MKGRYDFFVYEFLTSPFICAWFCLKKKDDTAKLALIVDYPYIGGGIGKKIMEWAEGEAKEVGCTKLSLSVMSDNEPAVKLYKKSGFKFKKTIKLRQMEKRLNT